MPYFIYWNHLFCTFLLFSSCIFCEPILLNPTFREGAIELSSIFIKKSFACLSQANHSFGWFLSLGIDFLFFIKIAKIGLTRSDTP